MHKDKTGRYSCCTRIRPAVAGGSRDNPCRYAISDKTGRYDRLPAPRDPAAAPRASGALAWPRAAAERRLRVKLRVAKRARQGHTHAAHTPYKYGFTHKRARHTRARAHTQQSHARKQHTARSAHMRGWRSDEAGGNSTASISMNGVPVCGQELELECARV